MCTVTFYPLSETEFLLTSSRDEQPQRETIPPQKYIENGVELMFPKDKVAGGTWIGASSRRRALTLMNGGFENHKRKPEYRMSRGIVVLNLLETDNVIEHLELFDFSGIEPFTIVLLDYDSEPKLYQIVWDEEKIHVENLELKPQIWSSTPLYTREMHALRIQWFDEFLKETDNINEEDIWSFHHTAGNGDKAVSLIMDRGFIQTKSITSLKVSDTEISTRYHDLQTQLTEAQLLKTL